MLARLEGFYLNVLRVAILLLAGFALLGAMAALVGGLYSGARAVLSSAATVEGDGLASFIEERRLAAQGAAGSDVDAGAVDNERARPLSQAIDYAATEIARYLNRQDRDTVTTAALVGELNALWLDIPHGHVGAYEAGIRRLADELTASTGRPLSRDRVLELLGWHQQRMKNDIIRLKQQEAIASANAWSWIGRAAQAFLLFVAVAFYFLLVRVERHLRVLNIRRVDGEKDTLVPETHGAKS